MFSRVAGSNFPYSTIGLERVIFTENKILFSKMVYFMEWRKEMRECDSTCPREKEKSFVKKTLHFGS